MKVAVVTPYYKEPLSMLERAHTSVLRQTHADIVHVMVSDGFPNDDIDRWDVHHIRLPRSHGDNGNTPRAHGATVAVEQLGCDAVAYLDADNWFEAEHIANLVEAMERAGTDVAASKRCIRDFEGRVLLPAGEPRDGRDHLDTSAILVRGRALETFRLWTEMPRALTPMCDTVYFYGLLYGGFGIAVCDAKTLNFQSHYYGHYIVAWQRDYDEPASLPCGPTRLNQKAKIALETNDGRSLLRLFRETVPAPLKGETEDEALLRMGSSISQIGVTNHSLPLLRAAAPQTKELKYLHDQNLGAALARQSRWQRNLASEAEELLKRASASPDAGPAEWNLFTLLSHLGRVGDAVELARRSDVTGGTLPAGYTTVTLGMGPYRGLFAEHWPQDTLIQSGPGMSATRNGAAGDGAPIGAAAPAI